MNALRFAHHFFHLNQTSPRRLWNGHPPDLADVRALFEGEKAPRRALKCGILTFSAAKEEFKRVAEQEERAGIRALGERDFPAALKAFVPPERLPLFLYLRGDGIPEEKNCIALVGTRFPSLWGAETATDFSAFFTAQNLHVVSGLAKGIDALSHRENLARGTVAVLGGGTKDVYPRENAGLAEEILERGGSLLSPFPWGQVPLPQNFPQRNEIIAALGYGTVVIEGKPSSGAAVTGKHALSMGKCVVGLTQDFRTAFGQGVIELQRAGATLVSSEEEALQAIYSRAGGFSPRNLPPVAKCFTFREFLKLSKADVATAIVLLQEGISSGAIRKLGPDYYRLSGTRQDPT
jgi:DNA protecting protein DprA